MATTDVLSLSGSSIEEERNFSDSSETDTSGSLAFTPIFHTPELFPYHAIGGSLDPRNNMDTSSFSSSDDERQPSTTVESNQWDRTITARQVSIEVDPGITVTSRIAFPPDSLYQQVSMEVEVHENNEEDNESLGGCSEMTDSIDVSTSSNIDPIIVNEKSPPVAQLDDYSVWQQWQATFQASQTPLVEDEIVDSKPIYRRPGRSMDLGDTKPPTKTTPVSHDLIHKTWVDPREQQHMQLHNSILPAPIFSTARQNPTVPLVPLRRDHSSGGTRLEHEIAIFMQRLSIHMKQEED